MEKNPPWALTLINIYNMSDHYIRSEEVSLDRNPADDLRVKHYIKDPVVPGEFYVTLLIKHSFIIEERVPCPWDNDSPGYILLGRHPHPIKNTTSASLKGPNIISRLKYARRDLADKLSSGQFSLRWTLYWAAVDDVLAKAAEGIQSMPASSNAIHVYSSMTSIIPYYVRPEEFDEVQLVQAAESAVKASLKDLVMEEVRNCTVCLEEMEVGCEASALPCKHVFHGECIMRWLRTSHCCPVCRFEVPTIPDADAALENTISYLLN